MIAKQSDGKTENYTYECPACENDISVDIEVKQAIIDTACIYCSHPVTDEAFSRQTGQ